MDEKILCPDCGGVVGATETTEDGPPCSCFSNVSRVDTAVAMPSPALQPEKHCVICGRDVAGHRRIKDSRGYICYNCAKEERRREIGDRVRCSVCGRLVKQSVAIDYETTKMCPQCHQERLKLQKGQIKRAGITAAHSQHERKRLYLLLAVGGALLLVIILNHFHLLRIF